ncbi:YqiA/YcfP family alpha/beta fold hydrolase [Piscinibacter sp. HJYY11]|uniref:YqiA/YcfP family alpha/beta fold hydrolase n=1 Tax=Piscinibacter sp. HJYY11 TaxID=2801333 RepID=UPI00191CE78A|nr:YqiA/YcfP family alpha/beta fold hydrolase [Piscinibacter sp. HJYY11]MBL0730164.1 esterase [Piscinibacter sp. HJYY11]
MTPTHLLYLHGFRSSPRSAKATRMAEWVREHAPRLTWWCPQLPPSPREAVQLLEHGVSRWPLDRMAIVGSSLGGFYATVMAERLGCKAVLLNPAVDPARDLARHIGETTAWHSDDRFFFRPEYVDELRQMTPGRLAHPASYFAVIATGDEVLSWREMSDRYRGGHLRIVEGSDHALSDFDEHLPHLLHFLELGPSP